MTAKTATVETYNVRVDFPNHPKYVARTVTVKVSTDAHDSYGSFEDIRKIIAIKHSMKPTDVRVLMMINTTAIDEN